jgi:hypothetical protein
MHGENPLAVNRAMVFTPPQYCELARQYSVRHRSRWIPPFPPVQYARVSSKVDGETIFYLWWDTARSEWVAHAPDEEMEELFA